MRGKDGLLSLAQGTQFTCFTGTKLQYIYTYILTLRTHIGIVHWKPPDTAVDSARRALEEDDTHGYCADDGLPALREALTSKIKTENNLGESAVMVTSGSNQVGVFFLPCFCPFFFVGSLLRATRLSWQCICPHATMCVFILLYMRPHTTMYVSSY